MLAVIRETYELYGFEAVETPFIEYTEALGKFLPDLDRPNEGVFSFQDDDEQVEFPQYTRPETFRGQAVPEVLLSGHHAAIEAWRKSHSQSEVG